jgi:hypothetical protein
MHNELDRLVCIWARSPHGRYFNPLSKYIYKASLSTTITRSQYMHAYLEVSNRYGSNS